MSRRATLAVQVEEASYRTHDHPTAPIYPDEIEGALQNALACLADLDMRYDEEKDRLAQWNGPRETKMRLAVELAELHQRDREPYVLLLAELHRRMQAATLFTSRHATAH